MRQQSTVESRHTTQSHRPEGIGGATQTTLSPVLRNALLCLDVRLEDELTRYRRQRAGGGRLSYTAGRRTPRLKINDRPLSNPLLNGLVTPTSPTDRAAAAESDRSGAVGVSDFWTTPASESHHAPSSGPVIVEEVVEPPADPALPLDAGVAVATAYSHSNDYHDGYQGDDNVSHATTPTDYLESSEELLKSLEEEEAEIAVEQGFLQNLLSPLGMGCMLLLLVSSAMFGYVAMNPASLSRFLATRNAPSANSAPETQASPGPEAGGIPQPNLATKEFTDLNLKSLGTLQPNGSLGANSWPVRSGSNPTAAINLGLSGTTGAGIVPTPPTADAATSASPPEPAIAPAPVVDPPAAREPNVPVYQAPEPARVEAPVERPAPPIPRTAVPAPSAPAVSIPPERQPQSTGTYNYKVVTPYTGDQSLDDARKVVPDAYLRNFEDAGAQVQVGAYQNESEAKARAEALRQQGIPAEVQKH